MKDTDKPTGAHSHRKKGHGFAPAVANKEAWHYGAPFNPADGSRPEMPAIETYEQLYSDWMLRERKLDPTLIAVTAGTPSAADLPQTSEKRQVRNTSTWALPKNRRWL